MFPCSFFLYLFSLECFVFTVLRLWGHMRRFTYDYNSLLPSFVSKHVYFCFAWNVRVVVWTGTFARLLALVANGKENDSEIQPRGSVCLCTVCYLTILGSALLEWYFLYHFVRSPCTYFLHMVFFVLLSNSLTLSGISCTVLSVYYSISSFKILVILINFLFFW